MSCADSHRALVCEGWRHGGVVFGCLDHWWPMFSMIVRKRSPKVIILRMSDLNCNGALLHICSHIAFVACWRLKASFLLGKSMFDTSVTLSPNMSDKIQPPLIYLIVFTLSPYYDESHGLMFSCTSFLAGILLINRRPVQLHNNSETTKAWDDGNFASSRYFTFSWNMLKCWNLDY